MSSIQQSLFQITALEELSHKDTPIHRMSPMVKILLTCLYIIVVISFGHLDFNGLLLYSCFPILLMIIGEIPIKPLILRCMVALPFSFFAGISNLIFQQETVFFIGQIKITYGMLSFVTLLLKTLLTVMAVLILAATTGIRQLIYGLGSLHLPSILTMQLIMTYRYLSIIAEETSSMHQAYLLRAPKEKGIKVQDFGKFLGQLLLRSFDRAERIYHSMQCRGFDGSMRTNIKIVWKVKEIVVTVIIALFLIILRFINLGELIGQLIVH